MMGDQDEFKRLMKGVPADPGSYDLSAVQCTKEKDRLVVAVILSNTTAEHRRYTVRYRLRYLDGGVQEIDEPLGWFEPGESRAVDTWFGSPESYPDQDQCDVQILTSPFEAVD